MPTESRPALERAVEVGPNVYLRRPVESDRDAFCALVEASRAFLRPWEPAQPEDPTGDRRFDRLLRQSRGRRNVKLFVCRRADDTILGCFNVNNIVGGVFECGSLGYWIGAPHARRGYMTEALQLGLRHAFGPLGLHRVEANLMPSNAASRALVARAGFRKEGYSPRFLQIAGVWADHERWALLADEWQPEARPPERR